MKVAMFPNSSGSAYWRMYDPAVYLRRAGIDARVITGGITDDVAGEVDIVVLQGCVDKEGIALLRAYQQLQGLKIVVDMDDYLHPADDNPYKKEHEIHNYAEIVKITMGIADMVTCTTEDLAIELSKYTKKVVVLPNSMDMERWDLPKYTNDSDQFRIGWVGSSTHYEDLKMIEKPLKRILDEFPHTKFIAVGELRLQEMFKGYNVEIMPGVEFDAYPAKLHGLRLDMGLAPLRDTKFNRCKSPIKFYEYAIAKVPGVYSPTVYHQRGFDGKFGMEATDEEDWYRTMKNMVISKEIREDIISGAYGYVRTRCDLKKTIVLWKRAYESLLDFSGESTNIT